MDRFDLLVLARIASAEKLAKRDLSRTVRKLAPERANGLDAALERLAAEGMITTRPLRATASGTRHAAAALRLKGGLPRWGDLERTHLAALAVPGAAPKDLAGADALRAALLCRLAGTERKLSLAQVTRLLAARAAGATASDTHSLRKALIRTWLSSEGETIERFAERVHEASSARSAARYGDDKVFISSLWREAGRGEALDAFKARLVEANRRGLVALERADLVEAMDPAEIAASETRHLNATFHFVRAQGRSG